MKKIERVIDEEMERIGNDRQSVSRPHARTLFVLDAPSLFSVGCTLFVLLERSHRRNRSAENGSCALDPQGAVDEEREMGRSRGGGTPCVEWMC